ncbi:MAG: hypothetical protein ACKVVT_10845 [Dehalococcoidia bacterium]
MNTPHPVLGRFVASYGLRPFKVGTWWLPLPIAAAAGGVVAGLFAGSSLQQALVLWAAAVVAAVIWVIYRWRDLASQVPLVIYDKGFVWAEGGDFAEVRFGEVLAMTPEERPPFPMMKPETWWVIEAEDGIALTISPALRDQQRALEWIRNRVSETVPEPVRRSGTAVA